MRKRFLDEGDQGGTGEGAAGVAAPEPESPPTADPKPEAGQGTDGEGTPDPFTDLDKANEHIASLTTKLGNQGNTVGDLRKQVEKLSASDKLVKFMREDPEGFKAEFEKLAPSQATETKSLNQIFEEGMNPENAKALDAHIDTKARTLFREQMMEIQPVINQVREQHFRTEFPTWDDDRELRDAKMMELSRIPSERIAQALIMMDRLPGALKAAAAEGEQRKAKTLERKASGQISDGGKGEAEKKEKLTGAKAAAHLTGLR